MGPFLPSPGPCISFPSCISASPCYNPLAPKAMGGFQQQPPALHWDPLDARFALDGTEMDEHSSEPAQLPAHGLSLRESRCTCFSQWLFAAVCLLALTLREACFIPSSSRSPGVRPGSASLGSSKLTACPAKGFVASMAARPVHRAGLGLGAGFLPRQRSQYLGQTTMSVLESKVVLGSGGQAGHNNHHRALKWFSPCSSLLPLFCVPEQAPEPSPLKTSHGHWRHWEGRTANARQASLHLEQDVSEPKSITLSCLGYPGASPPPHHTNHGLFPLFVPPVPQVHVRHRGGPQHPHREDSSAVTRLHSQVPHPVLSAPRP